MCNFGAVIDCNTLFIQKINKMKNILFIFILSTVIACSKQDATLINLKAQLGGGEYIPDTLLLLAPDKFSLDNAQQNDGFVHAPYFYNDVKIYQQGGLRMSCKVLNNVTMEFDMIILDGAFQLVDDSGNIALYEKQ